jgi:hypothetical protein
MPRIKVTAQALDLAQSPVPIRATVKVQAWDANGPLADVRGGGVVFGVLITVEPGSEAVEVVVPLAPTDGSFCYRWEVSIWSRTYKLVRFTSVPDVDDEVLFSALPRVDEKTFQPTPDVLAAWDTVRAATEADRLASVKAAEVAEGYARDADRYAGAADVSAGNAGRSAEAAGASSRDASRFADTAGRHATTAGDSASDASGFAEAADRRATDADNSAKAAAESDRKSGLSATAAGTSESNAAASERNAETSASETVESARLAAGSATDAGKAKTDTEKLKGDVEKVVQTATFLFVQQGDQPAGTLNLADVKTNALIHRRLIGNITGITLPTTPTPGQMITLVLTQDATGGRTLTTPAAIFGHEGMDPTLSTLPNSVDMIGLLHDGIRWWSMVPAQRGA